MRLAATGEGVTQIAVPQLQGNAVTRVLVATIDAAKWAQLFASFPVPQQATVTLIDGQGTIIARTLNNDRWAGKPASTGFLEAVAQSPEEGVFRNTGLDGVKFQSAHKRARSAGWTIGMGMPLSDVESTLLGPTLGMVGVGLLTALLAIAAAFYLGRRIARPVAELAESAKSLARGEAPRIDDTRHIEEVERANHAFAEASTLLRERQDALSEALARERQARSLAEEGSRAKDEFLAMLGHELRNPLNAVTAAMSVLERVDPYGEHATRSREIVVRQAKHLNDLVDDLLDVARVTSGKIVLDRRLVDLALVVRRSVAILQEAGRFASHPVDVDIGAAWVSGDETRLEQIAVNLLENAVKYTPPGKPIRVRVASEGNEAVFEVSDEGEGIAADLLPRIFDLFTQGERTLDRAQGGLGLGLTLVRNLTELHAGRVWAHSEGIGKGARFVVRLPLVPAPERSVEAKPAPAAAGRALRTLVIEDNVDSAETLKTLLSLQGHDVHIAHDGPTGVERALEVRPEVALVDIGLPGFDGFEVARRLRAAPGGDAIRLVALTGYGQPEDRRAAGAAGFDHFLVKPVDLLALGELLAKL
jgi:signal transduction histidine kinase